MSNIMPTKIKIHGAARVIRKLRRGLPLATKLASRYSCREGAERLRDRVRQNAPPLSKTAQLKTHVSDTSPLVAGWLKASIIIAQVPVAKGFGYIVGSVAKYAAHVEYGVNHPGTGKFVWYVPTGMTVPISSWGVSAHHIPQKPFFRPAIQWAEKNLFMTAGSYWRRQIKRLTTGG